MSSPHRRILLVSSLSLALTAPSASATPPQSATAAAACKAHSYVIYGRYGVSCSKARKVLTRFLDGVPVSGWTCTRKRKRCDGSGLSIDEFRGFRFR